jgi:hypothetical protein
MKKYSMCQMLAPNNNIKITTLEFIRKEHWYLMFIAHTNSMSLLLWNSVYLYAESGTYDKTNLTWIPSGHKNPHT